MESDTFILTSELLSAQFRHKSPKSYVQSSTQPSVELQACTQGRVELREAVNLRIPLTRLRTLNHPSPPRSLPPPTAPLLTPRTCHFTQKSDPCAHCLSSSCTSIYYRAIYYRCTAEDSRGQSSGDSEALLPAEK